MIRFLPFGIELFLTVFCLIDCIQSDDGAIRNLGRGWWLLLILLFPIVGAVAWLVAGRPVGRARSTVAWPSTRTAGFPEYERPAQLAPDDDPEFLASMRSSTDEKEDLLRRWEDDLRRRERDLGGSSDPDAPPSTPGKPPPPPPPPST